MLLGRRKHEPLVAEDAAVSEAIAVLEGRVVERLPGACLALQWGWVNKLAHGSWEDLAALADAGSPSSSWEAAASYLAGALLDQGHDSSGLLFLQRNAVIPVELTLLSTPASGRINSTDLAMLVEHEIRRLRRPISSTQVRTLGGASRRDG
jgi:hypothetical protein